MAITRRRFHQTALGAAACWATKGMAADETKGQTPAFVDGSFTIVALPDTQVYCEKYPVHFHNQTKWIAEQRVNRNIKFVVHLGDITNRNTKPQWEVARSAMARLDGVVPYSLALGNHDCGPGGNAADRSTMLNDFFSVADAKKSPCLAGLKDSDRLDNSFHVFTAGKAAFLVLALEWAPRDETVEWARDVVARHADHHVILTTHAYLYYDDNRYDWKKHGRKQKWNPHDYETAALPGGVNDGEELWTKLVASNPQAFLTVNGHVLEDGLGRLTSKNQRGKDVHQILVNYQMKREGGEGFLRLFEFLPDGRAVRCKSYSPSLDQYKTDDQNQFELTLNDSWA